MSENKQYIIDGFEYNYNPEAKIWGKVEPAVNVVAYVGPEGPGSVAVIPDHIVIEGNELFPYGSFEEALRNKKIEKVINLGGRGLSGLPLLKEIDWHKSIFDDDRVANMPMLETITFCEEMYSPASLTEEFRAVKRVYLKGINHLDKEVAGDGIHTIFGDEVENVGTIRGGHVTLGKGVKGISALKKAEFGIDADTTVAEYELPTRIDFLSDVPPTVGGVAPGAMPQTELHVPAGALAAYTKHPQWGKAAYFVDADGKTVDNYAAKHKARMKKVNEERAKADAEATEKAKAEKLTSIGKVAHLAIAPQRLAKWDPSVEESYGDKIMAAVVVKCYRFCIDVKATAPITIWDEVAARLEKIEQQLPG